MDLYRDEFYEKIMEYRKAKKDLEEKYKEYNDFVVAGCNEFVKAISSRYDIREDGIEIDDDGLITISAVGYYSGDCDYQTFFMDIYDLYDIKEALIKHKARVAEKERLEHEKWAKEKLEQQKIEYEKLKKQFGDA